MVMLAPVMIGLGAACVNGQSQVCGNGGIAGGETMIGLGSVLILWAMAFAIAVQSSRGGEDKTDAGVNFCTSLVILMVVMALVAPLALTGAGIKCLAERKEDPGWCVFAEGTATSIYTNIRM
jgi:hypothetical protein